MLTNRLAAHSDLPEIRALIDLSINHLLGAVVKPEELPAARFAMGVDTQLIDDGCYFVIEEEGRMAGCGGWSRRATLYGGDDADVRDDRMLDPTHEAARLRAMYTHPDFARRGVGRLIVELSESAAREAGFKRMELAATVAGEPLYAACGYDVDSRTFKETPIGVQVPLAMMSKDIG